jgi:CTP:molybdopterin cytidylyltransferase MocA
MGPRDKLLEDVDGMALLRQRAMACLASRADVVRVVLPPNRPERTAALEGLNVDIIQNSGSELGLSHSLQRGIEDVNTDAALIVLADLPDLTTADLDKVIAAAGAHPLAQILRGADRSGKPGHPVLVRKELYPELSMLTGDTGAQPLLKRHTADTVLVPVGAAALRDLDTPEDWATWRANRAT